MDPPKQRFQVQGSESAEVTPLAGACATVSGHLLSLAGRDLELILDQTIAPGAAVRVQARDWLMLGEVLYCAPVHSRHRVRLRLEHALPSPRALADLSRHFFGQGAREPREAPGYSGWT